MINLLLTMLLASVFIFDWLFFVMGIGGRIMTWIPEFIAIIIAFSLPLKTAVDKSGHVPFKYVLLIFLYLAHILFGFLLNDITGWTMLAGLRVYAKFIPIFLLPLIYPLSKKAFRNLLLWIYALTMVQLPVVLWQRFIQFGPVGSGDPMGGTLGGSASGVLAIYLISIISFLIAFYFKDEISLSFFLISAAAAFIPVTLNETKITSVLLPIAFIFPAFFVRGKAEVIFRVLLATLVLVISLIAFKIGYDYFQKRYSRPEIIEFWTDEDRREKYQERRVKPILDAFMVAPKNDLRFAIFGRGAGNISEGFTKVLSGKYLYEKYKYNIFMTFPQMMWEIGYLGTFLFLLFPVLVFFDSIKICKAEGIPGAYALGMVSFSLFFVISTIYTFTIHSNVIIFLYFFAAGQLVRLGIDARGEDVVPGQNQQLSYY